LEYIKLANYLSKARRFLMLPLNETEAIESAFEECNFALEIIGTKEKELPDNIYYQLQKLKKIIDTDNYPSGKWNEKIKSFQTNEKKELADIIDSLAYSFNQES
jgi:hypothetical protein